MRRILNIILLSLFSASGIFSQAGGDNVYEFLNLSPNAFNASMGGYNISLFSKDPSNAMLNPGLSGLNTNNSLSLNYTNYFAGINYGSIFYSYKKDSTGTFTAGINYLNYGSFDRTDESGNITGNFNASEYAFNIIYSRYIDSLFHIGVNLKPVISQLEKYISLGLLMDIGAAWHSTDGLNSAGLTVRNIGLQITTYSGKREKLPFEIMAGYSTRLQHAPFRFSITARHIEKYNLIHYYNEEDDPDYSKAGRIADNLMRHLIIGVELIPTENFFISTGFNYQRRKELIHELKSSVIGFSLGAGIKTSSFNITISRSRFHLAGASTNFSLLLKPAFFNKLK